MECLYHFLPKARKREKRQADWPVRTRPWPQALLQWGKGAVFEGQHLDIGEQQNGCPEMEEMLFLLREEMGGKHVYAI